MRFSQTTFPVKYVKHNFLRFPTMTFVIGAKTDTREMRLLNWFRSGSLVLETQRKRVRTSTLLYTSIKKSVRATRVTCCMYNFMASKNRKIGKI